MSAYTHTYTHSHTYMEMRERQRETETEIGRQREIKGNREKHYNTHNWKQKIQ